MQLTPFTIFATPALRTRVRAYLLQYLPQGRHLGVCLTLLQLPEVAAAQLTFPAPSFVRGHLVYCQALASFHAPVSAGFLWAKGVRLLYEDRRQGEFIECGCRSFRQVQTFAPARRQLDVILNLCIARSQRPQRQGRD